MLKKVNIIITLACLSSHTILASFSEKELIKGVFFGAGPVAQKIEYIRNSYSLKEKLSGKNLLEAERITDDLSLEIINTHPEFSKEFTTAVNEGNLTDILHHIEHADTVLTSIYEGQDNYSPDSTGVAVVAVAVVAAAVHNAVAVTSVAVVAVAAAVKVALKTSDDKDSLLHREKLSMELSRSFQK